jgi:hypothetical protein
LTFQGADDEPGLKIVPSISSNYVINNTYPYALAV